MSTKTMNPQCEALALLLSAGASVRDAAREMGLAPATVYRWSRRLDVMAKIREIREEMTGAAIASLQREMRCAVWVLSTLMKDTEIPPSVRCSAASKLLDAGFRGLEIGELLHRIEALEQKILEEANSNGMF